MSNLIKVVFLENSQNSMDGFYFRLQESDEIEIVGNYVYWENFRTYMHENAINLDVAILDVHLAVSPENDSNYPIFSAIPELLKLNPNLTILVISAHGRRALIQNALEVGATGYILKNDRESMLNLDKILISIVNRDVFVPEKTREILRNTHHEGDIDLTKRQLQAVSLMYAHPKLIQSALADQMHVEHSTYRNLLSQAYVRLGVATRQAAHEKLREIGLMPESPQ